MSDVNVAAAGSISAGSRISMKIKGRDREGTFVRYDKADGAMFWTPDTHRNGQPWRHEVTPTTRIRVLEMADVVLELPPLADNWEHRIDAVVGFAAREGRPPTEAELEEIVDELECDPPETFEVEDSDP